MLDRGMISRSGCRSLEQSMVAMDEVDRGAYKWYVVLIFVAVVFELPT